MGTKQSKSTGSSSQIYSIKSKHEGTQWQSYLSHTLRTFQHKNTNCTDVYDCMTSLCRLEQTVTYANKSKIKVAASRRFISYLETN